MNVLRAENPRKFEKFVCSVFILIVTLLVMGCATTASKLEAANKVRFEDTDKGLAIKINEGLLFKFGDTAYHTDADRILDELMSVIMKARARIFVEGHTDAVGSDMANRQLSKARAEKVARSLIQRRVLPSRIVATGYGSSRPERSPERTDEDAQLNRRAVIILEGENRQTIGADAAEARLDNLLIEFADKASQVGGAIKDTGTSVFQTIKDTLSNQK